MLFNIFRETNINRLFLGVTKKYELHVSFNIICQIRLYEIIKVNSLIESVNQTLLAVSSTIPACSGGWQLISIKEYLNLTFLTFSLGTKLFSNTVKNSETILVNRKSRNSHHAHEKLCGTFANFHQNRFFSKAYLQLANHHLVGSAKESYDSFHFFH